MLAEGGQVLPFCTSPRSILCGAGELLMETTEPFLVLASMLGTSVKMDCLRCSTKELFKEYCISSSLSIGSNWDVTQILIQGRWFSQIAVRWQVETAFTYREVGALFPVDVRSNIESSYIQCRVQICRRQPRLRECF